jgi:HEAT repeat protein
MAVVALSMLAEAALAAPGVDPARVREAVRNGDVESVRSLGPGALPELVRLYRESQTSERAQIARLFYGLGWKSDDAKRALMQDVHTSDTDLRLQVQWALGRVSDDPAVVDVLLDNMRNDPQPLFRDKAACALAYDQIHLAPAQKLRLFEGLIGALDDTQPQVRQVAIQALAILTGQTKGYQSLAEAEERRGPVEAWRRWLAEYRENVSPRTASR